MPTKPAIGDLWKHLALVMNNASGLSEDLGLWEQISLRPGGLWSEAQDETVLLSKHSNNIWAQASQQSSSFIGGQPAGLWKIVGENTASLIDGQTGLWDELSDETLLLAKPETSVWNPPVRDFAKYKPVRATGWALKKLANAKGEEYYVLKNLRQGTYLQLDERQEYLWNLMDGSRSVQDLAVANFIRYQTLSPEWLAGFLSQLISNGFLVSEAVDVYQASGQQTNKGGLLYWGKRLIGLLVQSEIAIKGLDRLFGAIYKYGGWLLFTKPAQMLFLLISLAGIPVFIWIASRGRLSLLTGSSGRLVLGLIGLLIAQIIAIFLHELSHALTTKHYGRQVRRSGVGLYFGMLVFFVDTTDIWMEPRRSRLAVTLAGPYSGFLLGGLATLAILIVYPGRFWVGLLYQFAAFCYALSILNLNPLLKLDGYYLLMDWMEMPMLRERSMNFVQRELWPKIRNRRAFSREEKIYAVFGALALLWTGVVSILMVQTYGRMAFRWVRLNIGRKIAWGLLLAVLGYVAYRLIRALFTRIKQGKSANEIH